MKRLTFALSIIAIVAASSPVIAGEDGDEPEEAEAQEAEKEAVSETDAEDEMADDEESAEADDEDSATDSEQETRAEKEAEEDAEVDEIAEDEVDSDEMEAGDEADALELAEPKLDETEPSPSVHPTFAFAPRVGMSAHQPFNDLGSWAVFGADVGVILPFDVAGFDRPLQIGLGASYTAPGAEGDGHHAMLGDAEQDGAHYQWELQQRMLTLEMPLMWRFMPAAQGFSAHALVGPRVYLMESVLDASGNDGADFGQNRETNTEYGFFIGGGAEYTMGPGSLFGTLTFAASPLDQRITGEANTGAFNLDVGYRLFF